MGEGEGEGCLAHAAEREAGVQLGLGRLARAAALRDGRLVRVSFRVRVRIMFGLGPGKGY